MRRVAPARTRIDAMALIMAARESLAHAHAPYSGFPVAAAVVDDQGRIFAGVNVENASYGLTMCAERVAIFTAVAAGARRIEAVAVTAKKFRPVTPCGACRQVFAELCEPSAMVYADSGGSKHVAWSAGDLLPHAFTSTDLETAVIATA